MQISSDFECGNIQVLAQNGDTVLIEPEIRNGSTYFYWAFCVCGAEGHTVHFRFPQKTRVGYFGAAVSHDLIRWTWSENRTEDETGEGFSYTFAADEHCVYFAHDMVYTPTRLNVLCTQLGVRTETFCQSHRGRAVPCFSLGSGERTVLITSRHHACESTGTYVLEGIARGFAGHPADARLLFVPFVDYDGVVEGAPGKSRLPHDHNRDYSEYPAIHPEVAAIRKMADEGMFWTSCDFHSPHHCGDVNDYPYLMHCENTERQARFAALFAQKVQDVPDAFLYDGAHDIAYGAQWNEAYLTNNMGYMHERVKQRFSYLMEVPYFGLPQGLPNTHFSQDGAIALGECFWEALRETELAE